MLWIWIQSGPPNCVLAPNPQSGYADPDPTLHLDNVKRKLIKIGRVTIAFGSEIKPNWVPKSQAKISSCT